MFRGETISSINVGDAVTSTHWTMSEVIKTLTDDGQNILCISDSRNNSIFLYVQKSSVTLIDSKKVSKNKFDIIRENKFRLDYAFVEFDITEQNYYKVRSEMDMCEEVCKDLGIKLVLLIDNNTIRHVVDYDYILSNDKYIIDANNDVKFTSESYRSEYIRNKKLDDLLGL